MTLREAISSFLERAESKSVPGNISLQACARSLELLTAYFAPEMSLGEITSASLRDFLARWYIENAACKSTEEAKAQFLNSKTCESIKAKGDSGPLALCDSLEEFFRWAEAFLRIKDTGEHLQLIGELRPVLPRAIEITATLSRRIADRGGAFTFPEFLTSFEQGGRSQYDFDAAGEAGSIEGYFRITKIEGSWAEAHEVITDDRVWPIIFPRDVASRLMVNFIINLELVRMKDGWRIAGCGFAYPPGTDL